MNVIECRNLTKEFKTAKAVSNLSFYIKENTITGLIGRNGAGKTTLLKIIAGYFHTTSGTMKVFNHNPFNSLLVSSNMIFIDDKMAFPPSLPLLEILELAGTFYENWDHDLAVRLFNYFSFNPKQHHSNLSKGMKSTFNSIIGIAARCSLTIMDEPTTGMDASVRKDFYRALLKDYLAHPRTIILSSHLISEIEELLEDVLLIKEGELLLHKSVERLREYAVGLQGQKNLVENFISNNDVIYKKTVEKDSYAVVKNQFSEASLREFKSEGGKVNPVSTEELCIYLTNSSKGGIDDVFNRG